MNNMTGISPNKLLQSTPLDVGIERDFLTRKAPELAYDIAIGLDGASNLAASYGLDPHQWDVLRQWPAFREMVKECVKESSGASGARERIRRKAEAMLENVVLMDLGVLMGDSKTTSSVKVDVANTISTLAGMGKGSTPANFGSSDGAPLIVINVGGKEHASVSIGGEES